MKKLLYLRLITLVSLSLLLISAGAQAQSQNKTKETTAKWFNSHEWLNGLQLQPHSSVDQKEFARQYHANKAWWDKAFEFMRVTDLAGLKPGTYPIDGENVFATVTEGPGKTFEQGKWESHRHYNDIQYVIKGNEKIGITTFPSLRVTEPYDNTKDIAFYTGKGKYYIATPQMFFIFFPQYAHRPGIKVDGDAPIKKLVIKVGTGK